MPKTRTNAGPQKDELLLDAGRFAALFEGNRRSSGRFDPVKERMFTEYAGLNIEDIKLHLTGQMGAGVVPIMDDDSCVWAAIDIDNHGTDEDLPLADVDEKIATHKLPLVACRSKSGGIHCYLFLGTPQPCVKIRIYMAAWAALLGYGGSEIFPKQGRLVIDPKEKTKALGNWINLPYMGGDDTKRYALHGGKQLKLHQFLDQAEKSKVSEADLRALTKAEFPEAPPCVQKMYQLGVAPGHRNEAMYNIVIYHRKATPDDIQAKAVAANQAVFTKPLPRAELQRTINSAARPENVYRCNEEPIRSLCDRETCVTRKFGITSGDLERLTTVEALPLFTDLVKYPTEPVRWEFKIDGIRVGNVGTPQLLDWRTIREIAADRLTRVLPLIKNSEWERLLQPMMKEARVADAPDDASVSGFIRDRLREFAAKADLTNRGEDKADRKALLRGLPVVQVIEGERCVVWRGADFVNFLKRTKSEELKGTNLFFAVKDIGVGHSRIRVPNAKSGEDNINVYFMPIKEVLANPEHKGVEPATFKSDL